MSIGETVSLVKDAIPAIAAVLTTAFAIWGLNSWRRELKGRAQFDVARSLIKATYQVREALQNCRSRLITHGESPEWYRGALAKQPHTHEEEAEAWSFIYRRRWEPVSKTLQEFDSSTLEAEVLWGSTIRQRTDELRQRVRNLYVHIEAFVGNAARGGQDFEIDQKFGERVRGTVSASPSDRENELTQQIASAVQSIETAVRPHMRRA